jgi:small-conductance mechanosensitive channel
MITHGRTGSAALALILFLSPAGGEARAQLPGVPAAPAPAAKGDKPEAAKGAVATASGPIEVARKVDDETLRATLQDLLNQYPGVRHVTVSVRDGVAKLEGRVDDDDTRDDLTDFTRRVEGVRLVLNRTLTDAEAMTGIQLAFKDLTDIWGMIQRKWLVAVVALVLVMLFSLLARLFNASSETLLAPFVGNPMLRAIVGSLISSGLVLGGMLAALSLLNLTHAVLSILGLAGVVGLAVGFAFKDITENFIASVLLGVRRPFLVGDYVTVAGQSGVVRSLNTRATVLVTLEGNHIRIPNNVVYKEILVNSTASTSTRGSFEVVVPYEVSTAAALEAVTRALREVDGVLPDPPARALVEALEPGGVRLKAYYWTPVRGVDWFQLNSEVKLRVKVALQRAGVFPTQAAPTAAAPPEQTAAAAVSPAAAVTPDQAEANLRRDLHAAENASASRGDGRPTPVEHVLNAAESRVSEEGANLLTAGSR